MAHKSPILTNEEILPDLGRIFSTAIDKPVQVAVRISMTRVLLLVDNDIAFMSHDMKDVVYYWPLLVDLLGIPEDVLHVTELTLILEPKELPELTLGLHPLRKEQS